MHTTRAARHFVAQSSAVPAAAGAQRRVVAPCLSSSRVECDQHNRGASRSAHGSTCYRGAITNCASTGRPQHSAALTAARLQHSQRRKLQQRHHGFRSSNGAVQGYLHSLLHSQSARAAGQVRSIRCQP